ncbi:unnamed protein product [Schistosoma haematobium]|nr:unnamed protein product [Schistosoma haematobium]
MDHESGHLKGPSSLLSPVYLEGKNLVKNKLLDEPFTKTSSASNTLSSLSLNNKSLKSSISLSYTSSVLHCDHEVTVRPNDKHHVERRTSVPSSLKSTPIDWLNDAIIKISDTSFQNILECTVDDSMKSNSIPNTFGNLLTYERRDTYKQLKLELISCISSSIVDGSPSKEKKIVLGQSIHSCIDKDPEFILKRVEYTYNNQYINSCNEQSRSFIKKYFSSCIRTPSDWIEVAEYYAMISGNLSLKGMPKVLRNSMTSKFLEFDQYQLAKHSKPRARANRSKKSKALKRSQSGVVVNTDIDAIIYRLAHSPRIYFTIKELIRRLHISRPKFNVMCVLGKPYPSDSTDFIRMGLEGDWDSSKAGTCMKFPIPVTWETELSVNGNNSDSWSKLITLNKVPHMAMLRNLRNILMSDIQDGLHEIVLKRLTDPRIIIEGKQFPFRYFSAFDTLEKCERRLTFQQSVYRVELIQVMKRKKKTPRVLKKSEWLAKHLRLFTGKWLFCNHNTLNRYKNALNTALELSMKHNLPPICGSTLIICSTSKYVNPSKNRSSKSYIQILGFLLGAMCTSICETPTTYVTVDDQYNLTPIEVVFREKRTLNNGDSKHNESLSKHKNMGILERTKQMYETRGSLISTPVTTVFEKLYAYRKQFDKIVIFGDCHKEIVDYVINYRTYVGPLKAIWGNLSGEDIWPKSCSKDGWIEFKGCTDQILRYIAEPNEDKLLERIEKMDEVYGLNKNNSYHFNLKTKIQEDHDNSILSKRDYFRSGWKCCQLFISSTFRDMHAERDLLCGILVPALRRNVALGLRVHLNEIDLRWGVPEPATYNSQALQICLEQAAASDIFVLLLGDRYGCIPDEAVVMSLPESLLSEVCKFYKPGMSMTEMEYHMARHAAISKVPIHERRQQNTVSFHEAIRLRICVFIRDSASIENVPDELKDCFEEYDVEKRNRLNAFKELIRNDGVIVSHNFKPEVKSKRDDNSTVQSDIHSICNLSIVPLYTSWSHSIEHAENGTGEAGGTLCASASNSIAVSGGGNCEVWAYFVGSKLENPLVRSICLRQHSGQITAVAVQMNFIATGSKDKNVAIYSYDSNTAKVTLQYIIHNASKDWIISLKWSYIPHKMRDRKLTLLVGSNDQSIHLYRIKSKKYNLKQTLVSYKLGIKSLDFNYPYIFSATSNGHVSVWRYGRNENFELISEMIISSPLDTLNSNTTNENVVNLIKVQSFEYTPCYYSSNNKNVINSYDGLEPHKSKDSVVDTMDSNNSPRSLSSSDINNNEDDSLQHQDITDENLVSDEESVKGTSDQCCLNNDELMDEGSDETPSQCSEKDLMTVNKCNNVAFNSDESTGSHIFEKFVNRPGSLSELLGETNVKLLVGQTISGSRNIQEFQFRVYEPSLTGYHATLSGHSGLIPCGLSCTKPLNSNNDDTLLISVAGQNCDSKTIGCDIRLWNLPLSNSSLSCKPTLQHTGPVICADYLYVTKNLQLCITGSVDGDCIIWATRGSSTSQSIKPITTATTTYQPLIRLTNSDMKPRYSINSIVTQSWTINNEEKKIDYFIFIAFGYEILILHIHLNHDILINKTDLENSLLELFLNGKQLDINIVELNALWSIKTIDGYAEIQRFKTDHIVVEMSALHHEPVSMNQCGVVALLSNGEIVIIPFKRTDDELIHLRVRDNHWCSSLCTYQDGILVAHNGSALFYPFDDHSANVFTPLRGSINNLENIYIDRIEPLCLPNGNSFKLFYIVTSKLKSEPRIIFFNSDEHMLLNISLEGMDLQVTAYCITSTHLDSEKLIVYLLLATSDSFLRLLKCSINVCNKSKLSKWEQVRSE